MFGNFSLIDTICMIPGMLIGFTFHEYAHAKVADMLGDKTPRFQGRLTLNPVVHIDLIGFVLMIFAKIGWAKPVETNPRAFKNYYKDDLKVTLAGPLANLAVAVIFSLILGVFYRFGGEIESASLYTIVNTMFYYTIYLNVMMFIFNLLPLPSFDGGSVIRDLFPNFYYKYYNRYYEYRYIIVAIILLTPIIGIIRIPIERLTNILLMLALKIGMF
ncbi:site-2 protease family protein [Clostridium cadaveris]|uniref:site-2 protease family protein n=1 Tax=Clostridium cadaveris TaxID=1529 RepID=UPI001E4F0475|nr:site-2 protease family protein [Clostridium cadaveris]UFH66148.1 site-2 protease family protein [Clostridium cadaveris]